MTNPPYGTPGEQPQGQQPGYPQQPDFGQPAAYGQQPGYAFAANTPPENNLVWAAFATSLCCAPLGIVAIVKAAQVNLLWGVGQHDAARQAAQDAKKYTKWAAIIGGIVIALFIVFYVVVIALAIRSGASFGQ